MEKEFRASFTTDNLKQALDIVKTYLKAMDVKDRHEFWEWTIERGYPHDKIMAYIQELMPGYNIDYFVDHQEGDEDLIPDVLNSCIGMTKGKIVDDFQYEPFWVSEIGHDRVYFSAVKAH